MKYNKSEIMKNAWSAYKSGQAWNGAHKNFAECLKSEWDIAKKNATVESETVEYFNEVCASVIKNGEDAVDEAFRAWRADGERNNESAETYKAHMRAWKAAVAVFRNIMPSFGTELVNSQILAEIQTLDIA